ncbi:DUF6036 family nucleotidyltransferase [Desertibacillus haloalkaliphilus]|uniref:DUF6036 family nucleotidyltransferase n=1 Tax=Desertibacillus haloalkaliphilus TaxID=1328930 RepID=UPI001C26D7D3|nr:DUF6036 family nucleotidyltransferase [Desertibacillus haloalkaliphilus]MBU8908155.1 hypothetical protein [Desertibacillus haloalkaliphilus]
MKKFRTSRDVVENLINLDYELSNMNISQKIEIVIFGGTAILLRDSNRFTSDIDAIINLEKEDLRVRKVLHQFSVNENMRSVMEVPPFEDFYPRSVPLSIPLKNLVVRVPIVEDLIISKLFSSRQSEQDEKDLIETELLDQANMNKLWDMYEEYKKDVFFPMNRYNSLENILEKRNEFKKRKK